MAAFNFVFRKNRAHIHIPFNLLLVTKVVGSILMATNSSEIFIFISLTGFELCYFAGSSQ